MAGQGCCAAARCRCNWGAGTNKGAPLPDARGPSPRPSPGPARTANAGEGVALSSRHHRAGFADAFRGQYFWPSVTALAGISIGSVDQYVVNTSMPRVLEELG